MGSEMCIRDSCESAPEPRQPACLVHALLPAVLVAPDVCVTRSLVEDPRFHYFRHLTEDVIVATWSFVLEIRMTPDHHALKVLREEVLCKGVCMRQCIPEVALFEQKIADTDHATVVARVVLQRREQNFTPLKLSFGKSNYNTCLLYTSPSPRDLSTSRMPSSA